MLTRYEIGLLMRNFSAWTNTGDPYRQVASHTPPAIRMQKVRVTQVGWYGPHRKPVELGQVFKLPLDHAQGERARGRVVFVV
jgi:hypothetical protein